MSEVITKKQKNKITTPGYFIKRLRDNGFIVWRIFHQYGQHDPRRWTVMVDPGRTSLLVTCYENRQFKGDIMFELHDGGNQFPVNFSIKTTSIEVIVNRLIEMGVEPADETHPFYKQNHPK